jgi:hypothetical protein
MADILLAAVQLIGWDEAPPRQKPGSGTDFH